MCFRLIDGEEGTAPRLPAVRVLGVSRAGYYAWKERPPSERAASRRELLERIRAIHGESNGTYGSPRVHAELRHRGIRVGRKRVERLMRAAGLSGMVRRRKGRTTIRVPGVAHRAGPRAPRLRADGAEPALGRRHHRDRAPGRASSTSPSSSTASQRRCVGWAMAEHMRAELVVDALEMAVGRRRPDAGLVHHSDRGGNTCR